MRINIPIPGGYNTGVLDRVSDQLCENLYAGRTEPGSKVPIVLYGTPGYRQLVAPPGIGVGRSNGIRFRNEVFFVIGNRFTVYRAGTLMTIGTLQTHSGRVSMACDRDYIVVVDGQHGYVYAPNEAVEADQWQLLTLAGHGFNADKPSSVTLAGRFFLVNQTGGDEIDKDFIFVSKVDTGKEWDPLDMDLADARPDALLAIHATMREVWMFGEESIQLFQAVASPDQPYMAVPGGIIEEGVQEPETIVDIGGSFFFMGRSKLGGNVIRRTEGYTPQRISTHGIEKLLEESDLSGAYAYSYQHIGHVFYILVLPREGFALCYDITTHSWHRRASRKGHRVAGHVWQDGVHYCVDARDGGLYALDSDIGTEDGQPIVRVRRSPVIHNDRMLLTYSRVECEFDFGAGAPGTSDMAHLRYSDDGGRTWSKYASSRISRAGSYAGRAVWNRLGASRERIFEVMTSTPNQFAILDMNADVEVLR